VTAVAASAHAGPIAGTPDGTPIAPTGEAQGPAPPGSPARAPGHSGARCSARRGAGAPATRGRLGTVTRVAQEWLTEEQQRTWRAFLTVSELLPRVLDAQLQRDAGLTHAAYIVLAMLSEAPHRSRRMSDLARRANQSQSRLSHTVARLEERGWVRRERSPEDGRGNVAVLTDAGWDIVRSLAPGHVIAVRDALFDPLSDEQTRALREALELVLERLDPDHSLRLEHGDAVAE
jgi:DNA-binding MarR family transcriptional regulator